MAVDEVVVLRCAETPSNMTVLPDEWRSALEPTVGTAAPGDTRESHMVSTCSSRGAVSLRAQRGGPMRRVVVGVVVAAVGVGGRSGGGARSRAEGEPHGAGRSFGAGGGFLAASKFTPPCASPPPVSSSRRELSALEMPVLSGAVVGTTGGGTAKAHCTLCREAVMSSSTPQAAAPRAAHGPNGERRTRRRRRMRRCLICAIVCRV